MGLVVSGPRDNLGLRTSASVLVLLDFIHPLKYESIFFLNLQFLEHFSRAAVANRKTRQSGCAVAKVWVVHPVLAALWLCSPLQGGIFS